MKTLFSKHKWMQLVYGGLLLVAGILVIVIALNNPKDISVWLSIVVAVALFIYAAALMFSGIFSLKDKYFDVVFLYAVAFVAIGVTLLFKTDVIGSFITVFIASLLCAAGLVEIGQASAMIYFKKPKFFIALFFILGAAFITLGVLAFCFQNNVQQIVYVASGVILVIAALAELAIGTHSIFKDRKNKKNELKSKKKAKEEVIEAPVEEKKEDKRDEVKTDA